MLSLTCVASTFTSVNDCLNAARSDWWITYLYLEFIALVKISSEGPLLFVPAGARGVQEEPQFVTARAGDNVILGCDVSHPLNGQPYVVEWFKYGMPIPFFINFRFYPPHVDPEYAGKICIDFLISGDVTSCLRQITLTRQQEMKSVWSIWFRRMSLTLRDQGGK